MSKIDLSGVVNFTDLVVEFEMWCDEPYMGFDTAREWADCCLAESGADRELDFEGNESFLVNNYLEINEPFK